MKTKKGKFPATPWGLLPPRMHVLFIAGPHRKGRWLAEAFAADGMAVWQQRYIPRDDAIYRVEMLGGEVLYRARVPVKPDKFNYCLGDADKPSDSGTRTDPVTLDLVPEKMLREDLAQICRFADMEVGSIEYLIPRGESAPCFFDINPVSTYHPNATVLLGFDPYEKLAAWLKPFGQRS